jgi:hypothetical protein
LLGVGERVRVVVVNARGTRCTGLHIALPLPRAVLDRGRMGNMTSRGMRIDGETATWMRRSLLAKRGLYIRVRRGRGCAIKDRCTIALVGAPQDRARDLRGQRPGQSSYGARRCMMQIVGRSGQQASMTRTLGPDVRIKALEAADAWVTAIGDSNVSIC